MKITRKGYYVIEKDGVWLTRENGEVRQTTSRDEAYEYIITNAEPGLYRILPPVYEVDVALTDAGVTEDRGTGPTDQPPTISSTPNPTGFFVGVADTYNMTQHVSDDGLSAVTYSLSNTLPNGLNFNPTTGVLDYDGVASATTSSHTLTATDAVGSAESASFSIVVTQDSPDQFTFTDQSSVALSTVITSAAVTIAGLTGSATITVSGGSYDINNSGNFQTTAGSVQQGDTVRARHTSSANNSTATNTTITIGGISDIFTSTTLAPSGQNTDWDLLYTNAFAGNNTGATYWLDPVSGSNSNTGLNSNDAFLTPAYAATQMVGGDELIVKDGTYTDISALEFGKATFPAGSAGAYTIIRAETRFGVRINTSVMNSISSGLIDDNNVSYLWFDGFICNHTGADSLPEWVHQFGGTRNRFTRIISRKQSSAFDNTFAVHVLAGGEGAVGNDILIQDCAFCGSGRYQIQTGGDSDLVMRRVVARSDFSNTPQPDATIINYSATDIVEQNVIIPDTNDVSDGGGNPMYAGFYDREFGNRNKYQGCIGINIDTPSFQGGINLEGSISSNLVVDNCVFWANAGNGIEDETNAGNASLTNITAGQNGNQNYAGANSPTNSRISDTLPANILDNTPGASIKFAMGAFLSHFGDTGWETLQTERLWPWPYEAEIRSLFSEAITAPSGANPPNPDATRGFCDDAIALSLTEYLFEQGTDTYNGQTTIDDFYA